MLGRCRRHVLVATVSRATNDLPRSTATRRDGIAPADFRAAAREELVPHGSSSVRGREGRAEERAGFSVALADGRRERSRYLLLATGVKDTCPGAGRFECYGRSIFHCPHCDGWECRDNVWRCSPQARSRALKTRSRTSSLRGSQPDREARKRRPRTGSRCRPTVSRVDHVGGRMKSIHLRRRHAAL
jgi:hypothetical protein